MQVKDLCVFIDNPVFFDLDSEEWIFDPDFTKYSDYYILQIFADDIHGYCVCFDISKNNPDKMPLCDQE